MLRDLVGFQSTEELVRVISHAMTAHDAAYFNAKILHRDISVGNILIDKDGNGFLIDWDLCTDDPPSAWQSHRTGTWQFISAALLRDPTQIQTIADDRESAIHVLTWLALRYTKHTGVDDLTTHLAPYDEVHRHSSIATGGGSKGDRFSSTLFPTFNSGPLNELLRELRKTFSTRYVDSYPADEIQRAKDFVEARTQVDPSNYHLVDIYSHAVRMEALVKRNWLVEVFSNRRIGHQTTRLPRILHKRETRIEPV